MQIDINKIKRKQLSVQFIFHCTPATKTAYKYEYVKEFLCFTLVNYL